MFLKSNLDLQILHLLVFIALKINCFTSGAVAKSKGVCPLAFFTSTSTPLDKKHSNTLFFPLAAA